MSNRWPMDAITRTALEASVETVLSQRQIPASAKVYCAAFLRSLAGAIPLVGPGVAAGSAHASARFDASDAQPWDRERWSLASLTWLSVALLEEAARISVKNRASAASLVALAGALGNAAGSARESSPQTSPRSVVETRMVLVRRALGTAHERALSSEREAPFVSSAVGHLRRSLAVLAAGQAVPERLVRTAIQGADRSAHADASSPWARSHRETRKALAALSVARVAEALADESAAENTDPTSGQWLARKACELIECATRMEDWLQDSVHQEAEAPVESTQEQNKSAANEAALRSDGTKSVTEALSEATMSSDNGGLLNGRQAVMKTLETDASDAAWRTAAAQMIKLTREPLAGLLSRHLAPGDESMRAKIAAFLQTELGSALLASVLSLGLSALPQTSGPVPQRLARELRVRAMSDTADQLMDVLMGPLRQVLFLYLQDPSGIAAMSQATLEAPISAEKTVLTAIQEPEVVG